MMNLSEKVDWSQVASNLSKIIFLEDLHSEVIAFLLENLDKSWAICCSGGADSLSLLLLIVGHFPEKKEDLYVLHYNHQLRGFESDSEALFVKFCAQSLGLSLILGEGNKDIKNKDEASLRNNRHQFFTESLKKMNGHILLLGHQCDDVAETMLMRLARGSGTSGLCAPRPVHRFRNGKVHLRPLINLKKERLISALEKIGMPWCNDSSNSGEYYFRNRIRHNVIPDWVSSSIGDFWKGLMRSRELLEEDTLALDDWLNLIFKERPISKNIPLDLHYLAKMPKALYRRALYKWLHLNGVSKHLNAAAFSMLLEGVINLNLSQMSIGDYFLILKEGQLCLQKSQSVLPIELKMLFPGIPILLPNHKILEVEELLLTKELKNNIFNGKIDPKYSVYLNYDRKENLSFYVRSWIPGDCYKPLGAPGTRKLQDMFVDKKIPFEERPLLPVVYEKSKGIAWCPGLPVSEPFKIEYTTQCALKLTFA